MLAISKQPGLYARVRNISIEKELTVHPFYSVFFRPFGPSGLIKRRCDFIDTLLKNPRCKIRG